MSSVSKISELMKESGVKFGTSGARGLVTDMTDRVCYIYTAGFLQYLEEAGELPSADRRVAVAGDLRPSTDRIMRAVAKAISDRGYEPVNCGKVPSPAVALFGITNSIPSVMVTGSHIPEDRNGIKYNKAAGEVLKDDEAGMMAQVVEVGDIFADDGSLTEAFEMPQLNDEARKIYIQRYLDVFPSDFLSGRKIGLYQHSAVGRDILHEIYSGLGADVEVLGRSETFIPVDTEAIRPEDVDLASDWARETDYTAIVSTDGDSDRPLVSDEHGKWLRGDVAGILCARYLGADVVTTPVSCNSAVEKSGWFDAVKRTRIGSPYVVAEMIKAVDEGAKCVVGYEANGGFLTASDASICGKTLAPLPTRDAVIIHLGIIGLAMQNEVTISQLLNGIPQRVTASDRIKEFPSEKSAAKIAGLIDGGANAIEELLPEYGPVKGINTTDGLRITFESEEVVHLRPSGNAPELRCYTEADSESRAVAINCDVISILQGWR